MSHVLVVRLDNDGDVLLAGPAVRAVAATARRLTMLVGPRGRQAAELLPGVDEVVVFRAGWIDPEPGPFDVAAVTDLVEDLRQRSVDQAMVLTSFHQSPLPTALVLRLAGVPVIGAISEDYPGSLLDVRHRIDDDVHEVERSLSLAAAMGHRLPPGDTGALEVRRPGATALPFRVDPYVVVHPGASVTARAWSAERHAALVTALADAGRKVALTGAPAEVALTASVAGRQRPEVVDLGGRTTLGGLVDVLAGAEVVVVGNTGPAHLAAAVGTPVVSIYAPTVPAVRWRPWRVPHVLLGVQDIACAGCRARVCPVPGHPCVESVDVADVLAAVESLAGRRRVAVTA